jgi:hypothetical protein
MERVIEYALLDNYKESRISQDRLLMKVFEFAKGISIKGVI